MAFSPVSSAAILPVAGGWKSTTTAVPAELVAPTPAMIGSGYGGGGPCHAALAYARRTSHFSHADHSSKPMATPLWR